MSEQSGEDVNEKLDKIHLELLKVSGMLRDMRSILEGLRSPAKEHVEPERYCR
jgi:hypothetical protein